MWMLIIIFFTVVVIVATHFLGFYNSYRKCKTVFPPEDYLNTNEYKVEDFEVRQIGLKKAFPCLQAKTDNIFSASAKYLLLLFLTALPEAKPEAAMTAVTNDSLYTDSTVTVKPGAHYKAGAIKKFILGSHYREIWATPVEVEVFDLSGWEIEKRGGGMQTKSLRIETSEGREFVLRSVDKYPHEVLPKFLRKSFVGAILKDQTSASHPYGAFVVPPLADALGLLHTNPRLVYIPYDERLGEYYDEFAGMLALFEEHADEDHRNQESFGPSDWIMGSDKMLNTVRAGHNSMVDQRNFLRARLLDMVVGDWDRHEGQWRWATFVKGQDTLFRPIPEDRDHVFAKYDGLLPSIFASRLLIRKLETFAHDYGDIGGLNYNAGCIDRLLLNSLSYEDWMAIADTVQKKLTDSVIEAAVRQMPPPVFEKNGREIIDKLRSRRDKLKEAAREYYFILAKEVNVTGTMQSDYIKIEAPDKETTVVSIFALSSDNQPGKRIYHRIFHDNETFKINVFGLHGNDFFDLSGPVGKEINLKIFDKEETIRWKEEK